MALPGGTSGSAAVALPVKSLASAVASSGLPFEVATATLSTSAAVVTGLGDVALNGEVVPPSGGGGSSCWTHGLSSTRSSGGTVGGTSSWTPGGGAFGNFGGGGGLNIRCAGGGALPFMTICQCWWPGSSMQNVCGRVSSTVAFEDEGMAGNIVEVGQKNTCVGVDWVDFDSENNTYGNTATFWPKAVIAIGYPTQQL